jgi:hypothetical protein
MFTTGGWDPDSLALMTCKPHRGHATSSGQPQVARRVVERKVQGDWGRQVAVALCTHGPGPPGNRPRTCVRNAFAAATDTSSLHGFGVPGCGSRYATTPVRTGGASNARERGCRKWEENQTKNVHHRHPNTNPAAPNNQPPIQPHPTLAHPTLTHAA